MKTQDLTSEIPADVTGWWVSEKYDGCRAIWTGKRLLTRNGKDWKAPAWFVAGMPNRRLDGELWLGRGRFDELVSKLQSGDWSEVKFMVFDLAESGKFKDRYASLGRMWMPSHVRCVKHFEIASRDDIDRMERIAVAMGGEGCVIRRPGCLYRPGRMGDVIKVKRLAKDVERWQG